MKFLRWWWSNGYENITAMAFFFILFDKFDKLVLFPVYLALWLGIKKFNSDRQRVIKNEEANLG